MKTTPAAAAVARVQTVAELTAQEVTPRFIVIRDGTCSWFARASEVKAPKLVKGDGGLSYTVWCQSHRAYHLMDLPASVERAARKAGLDSWGF